MNIGQIVSDAWNFVLAPVINALCLALLGFYLARQRLSNLFKRIPADWLAILRTEQARKAMEAYGISKILPLAVLFVIVFVLYAARVGVQTLGYLLPGDFTYSGQAALMHADHADDLMSAWAMFPHVNYPSQLADKAFNLIELAEAKDTSVTGSGGRFWRKEIGKHVGRVNAVKAYALIALFLAIWQSRGSPARTRIVRRLLLTLFVLAGFGTYYAVSAIYAVEQMAFADLRVLRTAVVSDSVSGIPDSVERSRRKMMDIARRDADDSWWHWRLMNTYFMSWSYRTLAGTPTFEPAALDTIVDTTATLDSQTTGPK